MKRGGFFLWPSCLQRAFSNTAANVRLLPLQFHFFSPPGSVLINVDEFITVKPNDISSVAHVLPIA